MAQWFGRCRLLLQLDETAGNFDAFWTSHRHRLEQCLQLRHFEEQFKQVYRLCLSLFSRFEHIESNFVQWAGA